MFVCKENIFINRVGYYILKRIPLTCLQYFICVIKFLFYIFKQKAARCFACKGIHTGNCTKVVNKTQSRLLHKKKRIDTQSCSLVGYSVFLCTCEYTVCVCVRTRQQWYKAHLSVRLWVIFLHFALVSLSFLSVSPFPALSFVTVSDADLHMTISSPAVSRAPRNMSHL